MPPSGCPSLRFAPDTFRGKRRWPLAFPRMITDAARMDSDAFLESCRHDNEREVKNVRLPSLEEIETVKRQIRAENDARDAHRGPPQLKVYRRPNFAGPRTARAT